MHRRVWRYQRGNQNPYIDEEQTIQWSKDKVQKNEQRSTKHTHKTKDQATRTPLKTGDELRCTGRVSSSCSTSVTRCVNLVTKPVISHEWWKDWEVFTTNGFVDIISLYQCIFVTIGLILNVCSLNKMQILYTNTSNCNLWCCFVDR